MTYKIGFLLNHDAAHQAAHSVPVAIALANAADTDVVILVTSLSEADATSAIIASYDNSSVQTEFLQVPRFIRWLDSLTGHALALKRLGILWHYRHKLATFDALVVPEKTSALLKKWLHEACPLLINIRHGAGDRACGNFGRNMALIKLQLLPGSKYERLLLSSGHAKQQDYAVIGYPKLEHYTRAPRPNFFRDQRPVVVYAPHFDPLTSSWYDWGVDILTFFAEHGDYNLIFAPHVLLFARGWHVSSAGGKPRRTGSIPPEISMAGNILIDKDSLALVDMSYIRGAHIYLGDVSSQVYEFMHRPRPCVFLNPAKVPWQDDPQYQFWHCGQVIDDLRLLGPALAQAHERQAHYLPVQQQAFADTFAVASLPATNRGANAILQLLQRRLGNRDS
jgi:hypothetical protein